MTLTLWDHPFSPYAQKVKIALREKGLAFETVIPGGIGAGGMGGDFLKANPRGEVPALIDGEVAVFDSTIILEYLEDAYPDTPMLPATPAERARARMLEEVVDTHLEAVNWGLSEITHFRRGAGGAADTLRTKAGEQIAGYYAWAERELGDAAWFNGATFGWADLSILPYILGSIGHGHPVPEGSRLADWVARCRERPSVIAMLEEAAAVQAQGGMGNVADLLEQGLFKREYRDHRLEWMIKSGGIDVVTDGLAKDNIRFSPDFR